MGSHRRCRCPHALSSSPFPCRCPHSPFLAHPRSLLSHSSSLASPISVVHHYRRRSSPPCRLSPSSSTIPSPLLSSFSIVVFLPLPIVVALPDITVLTHMSRKVVAPSPLRVFPSRPRAHLPSPSSSSFPFSSSFPSPSSSSLSFSVPTPFNT